LFHVKHSDRFAAFATATARWTGKPLAFGLAVALVLVWAALGPYFHWSDAHQLWINTSTTVVTFLMVFLIQAQQNRDGLAIQAKLDELIIATSSARNEIAGIDIELGAEEIEELRHPSA
jgi:low affinity Fe/Cu permease